MEVLVIGPQSSGKTLFIKQLKSFTGNGQTLPTEVSATIPTVGTNMTTINLSKRETVNIRELGGCMAPIWSKYYPDKSAVIFMMDKSNPYQLSADVVLLLDILSDPQLAQASVLIVWNKIDCENLVSCSDITSLIDMNLLRRSASQNISEVECSCLTAHGFQDILQWLRNCPSMKLVKSAYTSVTLAKQTSSVHQKLLH